MSRNEIPSDSKDEIVNQPEGVLVVHIKKASKINIDEKEKLGDWRCLMLRIIVNDVSKESKVTNIDHKNECKFDDLKHFLIKINPIKEDIKNELKLELYAFGKVFADKEYYFKKLAHRYINIVDLVRVMHVCEEFEMTENKKLIALLDLEFCFSYGCFGYGYANQIALSDKTEQFIVSQEKLAFSAFLRVKPPEYRKVEDGDVTDVVTIKPPKIINFTEIVELPKRVKTLPCIYDIKSTEFPLVCEYFKQNQNYFKMQNEFNQCKSRYERLEYLQALLNNRDRYLDIIEFNLKRASNETFTQSNISNTTFNRS